MARKPREKRENWLLIKGDDEFAREDGDPAILDERPESVKTGRVVEEVADEAPGWSSKTGRIEKPADGAAGGAEEGEEGRLARLRRTGARDPEARRARPAPSGCTRSSSTATACRRISATARRRS